MKGTEKGTARRGRVAPRKRPRPARRKPDPLDKSEPADPAQVAAAIIAAAGEPPGYRALIAPFHLASVDPKAAAGWLTYYEAQFSETKNPVFVWSGLGQALGTGAPLPAWLTSYLAGVSEALHAMSRIDIPEDALAAAVYRALGFTPIRGVNPFRAVTDVAHDFALALDVWAQLQQGEKLDGVLLDVAQKHPLRCGRNSRCETISRSTVTRIWQQHRHHFLKEQS